MAAEPIEIIIRKAGSNDTAGFGIGGGNVTQSPIGRNTTFGSEESEFLKSQDNSGNKALAAAIAFASASLKRSISFSISQYGNQTGNYITQKQTEFAIEQVNMLAGIGMSIAAGFKVGGIWGAAIAGGISIASTGISLNQQYKVLQMNISKLNTQANIMLERSGNSLNNGSRGTYE